MRIAGTWNPKEITPEREQAGIQSIWAAYEAGFNFFDHADIYSQGGCESIHGAALKQHPELRNAIVATKCGIRFGGDPNPDSPHRYDFSKEHILWSCDQSLRRLGVDKIDLYQLHRPDALMDPHDVAEAFTKLHEAGKVRWFGVSNFRPAFVSALKSALPFPLIVNQVEIHLGRLEPYYDGTLDQCLELEMTPLSWSPLGGGFLGDGGEVDAKHPQAEVRKGVLKQLDEIAARLGVSRTVLALAWLMKHPSKIVPIVGTVRPERIKDAVGAAELDLDREDWYRLFVAARGRNLE